mmetsp:Transcript_43392/g.123760  ORF Transcript_43392/g.123760 Transcript_43392/m.123760 type:complete len:227 (-) Transcript_43392:271-951(-)
MAHRKSSTRSVGVRKRWHTKTITMACHMGCCMEPSSARKSSLISTSSMPVSMSIRASKRPNHGKSAVMMIAAGREADIPWCSGTWPSSSAESPALLLSAVCPAAAWRSLTKWATSAGVGRVYKSVPGRGRPRDFRRLDVARPASTELPPSDTKSISTLMLSIDNPNTSANVRTMASSVAFRGATMLPLFLFPAPVLISMSGSAFLSSLPRSVVGSCSMALKAEGTM